MAMTLTVSKQFNIGGKPFSESRSISGAEAIVREVSVPAATAGTVAAAMTSTTSTTTTQAPGGSQTGTLTLGSVSGFTIGSRLDVYWNGGALYGATIEDVDSVAKQIVFSGGVLWAGGSAFPSNGTAIQAAVPTALELKFTGSNCQGIVGYSDAIGTIVVDTSPSTDAQVFNIATAACCDFWISGAGAANPLAGKTITQVFFSHNVTTGPQTMRVGALVNP